MYEKARTIFLNGSVNAESSLNVILQLLYFEEEDDSKEINLYINSSGGSVLYGLAIYDVIQYIKAPVTTVCCGMAASMGAFLLTCGQKGKRYALPHSRILIHQPLLYSKQPMMRTQSSLQQLAQSLAEARNELERIMARNIGKELSVLHQDCERDHWLSAKEALSYGIIDKIIVKEKNIQGI